ncbi:Uncharacterised protein [Serratia proteamaculans]|uniref:hypothetical protein n=1 Tax=Serratia proteamaculans TaxID=28151 RepID=UPI00124A28FE|nr:hypothetical protein [Serratia proteamaculans]KAB1493317.1 hypothetical protein F8R23_23530 [Serratia proteamaculans]CAI1175139.1 Uncharacterised protein [Serratia proteamaculans]CAI1180500.1 Uncharacterised protein [Serratia proteamaculans]
MIFKVFGLFVLCLLVFLLGFCAGGVSWGWRNSQHSNDVAFLTMLGGWVSGLATLAAVGVSLYMAYQASQNDVEKIKIGHQLMGGVDGKMRMDVHVQSLRNTYTEIKDVRLIVKDKKKSIGLNQVLVSDKNFPCVINKKGELCVYSVTCNLTPPWWGIFKQIELQGGISFGKAKIQICTNMDTYVHLLPCDFIIALKTQHNLFKKMEALQHV